jgi:transposase
MKRNIVGLVPMPTEKITFKKIPNGTLYVYRIIRAYRNNKGKPTSDEVAIGKKDMKSGMLVPNAKYFDYYPEAEPMQNPPLTAKNYGNCKALGLISDKIGLTAIVAEKFPELWHELITCAMYMACENNVMMYINDWCDMTETLLGVMVDQRRCGELFASISHDARTGFFQKWVKTRSEQEYIAYDVTSISTSAQDIDIAEWGHNRDGDNMQQINLGMYYGESSKIPVYYNVYNGSVPDKTCLSFMLENAKSLGICNVRYVMDRGFMTEPNLKYMHENTMPFIIPMPMSMLEAKQLFDECMKEIRTSGNWINKHEIYGHVYRRDLYGFPMHAHLYFSPDKCTGEEKKLHERVEKLAKELESLPDKRIPKKYTDYFNVTKPPAGQTSFEIDNKKFDEHLRRAGYFVFLTSDLKLSPLGLVDIYKNRDVIEKAFFDLKNNLDFRRLRTHSDKTTEGKIFVGFLALIMRSYILSKIKASKATERYTIEKALLELKKIKVIDMADGGRILSVLTKTQKDILSALGLPESRLI